MNKLLGFKTTFTDLGWSTGTIYAVARLLQRYVPFFTVAKYYIVAQPVAENRLVPQRLGKGIRIREIDIDNALISQLSRPHDEILRRFAGGARCFLATRNDSIIGHLWITQAPYREPVHRCELAPHPPDRAAWDFDMWVAPEERLGLAFAKLWDQCNSYLRERGVEWTFSRVSAFNLASLRAHERLGMRVMHTLIFLGAGPFELLVADVAPFCALSLSRRTFPVLQVGVPTGT